jgi:hypothetical protein
MDSPEFTTFKDYFEEPKSFDYPNFKVNQSETRGRYFTAKQNMKAGKLIMEVKEPLWMMIDKQNIKDICSYCAKQAQGLRACS